MKMRVSIARAIAAGPKLLLMDEPFAALDELARQALNDDLLALAREDLMTVLFVTHSVFESTYLSSRVVVMTPRPGRVTADIRLSPPPLRDVSYRLTQEFADGARRVSEALRGAMGKAHEKRSEISAARAPRHRCPRTVGISRAPVRCAGVRAAGAERDLACVHGELLLLDGFALDDASGDVDRFAIAFVAGLAPPSSLHRAARPRWRLFPMP